MTDTLRTCFCSTPDGYAQIVLKRTFLNWEESTVADDTEVIASMKACYENWLETSRQLTRPPIKILIVRSPSRTVMCISIFHALYDGASLPLLLNDVQRSYHMVDLLEDRPQFPEVLPYGPICPSEAAEEFWKDHLANIEPRSFPKIITDSADQDVVAEVLLTDVNSCFNATQRRLNVTHQAILQACWASTLRRYLGESPIFGVIISGRSIPFPGAERTIGPLFNTIPFCARFRSLRTIADVIQQAHTYNLKALPLQHTPLRDIMKWCKRSPELPLFETLFVFQKDFESDISLDKQLWNPLDDFSRADVS